MRSSLALAAAVLLSGLARPGQASLVTVEEAHVLSFVHVNPGGLGDEDRLISPTVPPSTTLTATKLGSTSTTVVNHSQIGGQTIFDFDFAHQRSGVAQSHAGSATGNQLNPLSAGLRFSVMANTTYSLSGFYNLLGPGEDPDDPMASHAFQYIVTLVDLNVLTDPNDDVFLFSNLQRSRVTSNETFTLGQTGGDYQNTLTGSQTGSLIAGNKYELRFDALVYAYDWINGNITDNGAKAIGNVNLTIGETTAVPEPTSLTLCGLGALSLALGGLRRHRRQLRKYGRAAGAQTDK